MSALELFAIIVGLMVVGFFVFFYGFVAFALLSGVNALIGEGWFTTLKWLFGIGAIVGLFIFGIVMLFCMMPHISFGTAIVIVLMLFLLNQMKENKALLKEATKTIPTPIKVEEGIDSRRTRLQADYAMAQEAEFKRNKICKSRLVPIVKKL